ncbi:unnamed protein product [Choristocarpus tenellus]
MPVTEPSTLQLAIIPSRRRRPSPTEDALVPVRLLVQGGNARSERDNALMRSLISLMPHEQADSEFSVTAPLHTHGGNGTVGEQWGSRTRGSWGRQTSSGGSSPFSADGGLADTGLDFLGSTDAMRDLFHLPYTSETVTVGLHRVGQTLVLDGNLGEVLTLNPPSQSPSPSSAAHTAHGGTGSSHGSGGPGTGPLRRVEEVEAVGVNRNRQNSSGTGWVLIGRGGKPQREGDGRSAVSAEESEDTADRSDMLQGELGAGGGDGVGLYVDDADWPPPAGHGEGILSVVRDGRFRGTFGARPPAPEGFWRSFQWELGGMRMILGSNLQV